MRLLPPYSVLRVVQSAASVMLEKEPRAPIHLRTQVLGPLKRHVSSQSQVLESRPSKVLLTETNIAASGPLPPIRHSVYRSSSGE